MRNTRKSTSAALFVGSLFAATAAPAAVINLTDFSATPDGSTTSFRNLTDVDTANGGNVLPSGSTSLAYFVTTFNFGTDTSAHLFAHFVANLTTQPNRVGVQVVDTGLVTVFGGGALQTNSSFDLAQNMAGQSVTMLIKLDYDVNRNTENAADTLMEVWVNPTASSLENDSDMSHVWNSASFPGFVQRIDNESTPNTAGDSSITNTRIYTEGDATFENALNFATIPEPSTALLGVIGMLALLRRRR